MERAEWPPARLQGSLLLVGAARGLREAVEEVGAARVLVRHRQPTKKGSS